ncbi:MAG TPA: hypothetical protein VFG32_10325 [Bacteroidota bacterium]|nr:hypothetical protein [Bacteroidota bacterium]
MSMTSAEQRRMIEELSDHTRKMKRYDLEEFEMFAKRNKDDEDLDLQSEKRLRQMYDFYVVKQGKGS